MKNLLLVSAALLLLSACEPADPSARPAKSPSPPSKPATAPVKAESPAKPAAASSGKSLRQEISDAVDYGIGAAQLRAKQQATEKIDNISQQRNADLEKALKE